MQNTEPQHQPSGTPHQPIPTKAGTHWREFRIRYIPLIVFGATLFGIWTLWQNLPGGSGIRGIAEGAVSMISSPQDGYMENVTVPPHGWAEAGEPVVTIRPFDPRSQMDLFQSQMQIARLALEPSLADRSALDYEQLRVDLLRLKQELAMAQANLDRAEKVLPRHQALVEERLLSKDLFDLSVRDRDFYAAEVREKSKAIEEMENRLQELQYMTGSLPIDQENQTNQIIPRLQEQIASVQTNMAPVTLTAPISGEVNYYRHAREFVRAGEPVLLINSPRADRVIAYLKQPLPFDPEVGMQMEVTTRSRTPQKFITEIAQVGARVEVLTNAIAYLAPGAVVDTGLPLILPVPEHIRIRPGEVVDVALKEPAAAGTFAERLFGALK